MPFAVQTLTPAFESLIRGALPNASPERLAADVKRLSDFYNAHPGSASPWGESFTAPATLAYFMPLNFARLMRVFREAERFLPEPTEIWDFGSGLGTTQWVLEERGWFPGGAELLCLERSSEAAELHRRLEIARQGRFRARHVRDARPKPGALAVFSYSFLEMESALPSLETFSHWLILEPSTRERGRALMEWRARFIDQGFSTLAPCTHDQGCPLLVHSGRDWCHMRVHFEAPDWWLAVEEHLPMSNRTLTYSYLIASREAADTRWRGRPRVIGDTLVERGKTRQMICRGPEREFLSWLHKHGEPPRIPRGALIEELPASLEKKGQELRLPPEFGLRVHD